MSCDTTLACRDVEHYFYTVYSFKKRTKWLTESVANHKKGAYINRFYVVQNSCSKKKSERGVSESTHSTH